MEIARNHAGYSFSSAVQHHWRSATFTTWEQAVEELRQGIVINLHCTRRGYKSTRRHQIRLCPDGSVELLDHPGEVDEAAERMLAGLGSAMATCTAVALCFPTRTRVEAVGLNKGARQPLDGRIRMLWAAVTWAQDPTTPWSKSFTANVLGHGVSRDEAIRWAEAGWSDALAQRFWKQWATFEVAEQWRAAGRTDQAAAVAAGLNQRPDDDQQWLDAGFTPSRSARWRKNSDLSPREAIVWDRFGTPPTEVDNIKRLARTVSGLTMDTILDWCRAGVPANAHALRAWWEVTGGDLDLSVKWAPTGIAPAYAYAYEDWNAEHPDRPLDPAVVKAYKAAGFAVAVPSLVAAAHDGGVSPAHIRQMLADPSRIPDPVVRDVYAIARADRFGQNLTVEHTRSRFTYWLSNNQFDSASTLVAHLAA